MKTNYTNDSGHYAVYPGEFTPHDKIQSLPEELTHSREGGSKLPPVNIRELKDCFVVEMAVPGVQREDFDVQVDGNILSIAVLHRSCENDGDGGFRLHEFNYECFKRQVELPVQADTEFMRAEYRSGILYVYLQKSGGPPEATRGIIVVY